MKGQMKKLSLVVCCVIAILTSLTGCGGPKSQEDILADMKEFVVENGSASIYLDSSWELQDMGIDGTGIDFWLAAANKSGTKVAMLMQYPKHNSIGMVSDMESVKSNTESSYNFTADGNTYEAPAVPGMTNVSAVGGDVSVSGSSAKAYIVYGETDYACYAFLFGSNKLGDSEVAYAKASLSMFKENAPEEEDASTAEVSDTVRWFNASYAVLTELNGWDYNRFAGLAANEETKQSVQELLKEWWDVSDRASADETLNWALTEGHRTGFKDDMSVLKENGIDDVAEAERAAFIKELVSVSDDEAQSYADQYAMYAQFGETAIDGWDYCRALNLLGYYYIAGYYTEQEALDKSLEIAQTVQTLFGSWDELIDSYLRGYECWQGESSDERRAVYEDLKTREDNPYSVDFKMTLEKTW